MSIWIRLIGGAGNGQVKKVDEDQVELFATRTVPLQGVTPFRQPFGLHGADAEIERSRYTRRVVTTPDGKIFYFALDSLSDLEALQSVLGP